ncbi:hypothetical protein [Neptuniibacter sp. QD37_11]|uniref:hypothetical protein n=1 Tax=Neptuniibacter sp. QD37_11 TaxID=3398209 RepID=UPI0039F54FB8
MSKVEILKQFGLKHIGKWEKSNEYKSTKHLSHIHGINFVVPNELRHERDVVYAFEVEGQVLYVGETTVGIASRFGDYRYGNSNPLDTDNRIKCKITETLESSKQVNIWFMKPKARYQLPNYEYIDVPASKPLEEVLINQIRPVLNVKNINSTQ